jgi:hypothetical protein
METWTSSKFILLHEGLNEWKKGINFEKKLLNDQMAMMNN